MADRPFLTLGITELEVFFEKEGNGLAALDELLNELTHRSTQRAKRLESRARHAKQKLREFASPSVKPATHRSVSIPESSRPIRQDSRPAPPMPSVEPEVEDSSKPSPDPPVRPWKPRVKPPVTNSPGEILSAWIAQEVLSPLTYRKPEDLSNGDRRRACDFSKTSLPWENGGEKALPRTRLFYHVVLGSVHMAKATKSLLDVYADTRPEPPKFKDRAAVAVVTIDRSGRPAEDDGVVISSFAWGLGVARGDLRRLACWPEQEPVLECGLRKLLVQRDDDDEILPLTREVIDAAFLWLRAELALESGEVEAPRYALRAYQWYVLREHPDAPLLNSFFLGDLAKVKEKVEGGKANRSLRQFLGIEAPEARVNLLQEQSALAAAVSPAKTPLGRWPNKGRHSLALLQQAAINLAISELENEGVLGVNGPPGTGKTTLLRDLAAALIVQRAEAMVAYDDPAVAFTHHGQIKVGAGFVHLYTLASDIKGYEMLVASSNNKAVENISKELPGLDAIASDLPPPRYFRTTSDAAAGEEGEQTWGLITAVLGNKANQGKFRKAFWQDDETSLKSYLKEAAGQPVRVPDPDDPAAQPRIPAVVQNEKPPGNHDEALRRWKKACHRLNAALAPVRKDLEQLERTHRDLLHLPLIEHARDLAAGRRQKAIEALERVDLKLEGASAAVRGFKQAAEKAADAVADHRLFRPSLLAWLFRTRAWKAWKSKDLKRREARRSCETRIRQAELEKREIETERDAAHTSLSRRSASLDQADAELKTAIQGITKQREVVGSAVADDAYWSQDREALHKSTPWLHPSLQRDRDRVFVAAIEVHEAFIAAAAKPLRHNLAALMQIFLGKTLRANHRPVIPDLWASLFLVTPVISTTFASVGRMLNDLPPSSLGWLLIDEAGQSVPQAAVGALMRSRRALVVGDPLQIEPVVALPDSLTDAICFEFGVDPDIWGAPKASVQTVVDQASRYGTELALGEGSIWIGIPLLVHRRCESPMFGISNQVAYHNLMVMATPERQSPLQDLLGPSKWISVTGSAKDKWCPDEGEIVVDLLGQIANAGIDQADIFIISPFRVVAERLRDRLRKEPKLLEAFTEHPNQWLYERIGTVHTFQGKEAEAVVFLLGASLPRQRGARSWAGGRPNLVNVAVTRAKSALYVVGNRDLWRQHGFFRTLDRYLPRG
ncbi:MAG: hypothetical protein GY719_05310 [bacterium]|nr:hypothetical protein [bacterium]